jgi:hypothetical protein
MVDRVAGLKTPVLFQWPSMNKVEMHPFCILDSRSVYILLATDMSLGANNRGILFVWLGSEFSDEKWHSQVISTDGKCGNSHLHWEAVGRNLLNQMDLSMDAPVQVMFYRVVK